MRSERGFAALIVIAVLVAITVTISLVKGRDWQPGRSGLAVMDDSSIMVAAEAIEPSPSYPICEGLRLTDTDIPVMPIMTERRRYSWME